jgi:hypothetical protein
VDGFILKLCESIVFKKETTKMADQEIHDFGEEEKDLYANCSREAAVTFKFFELFSFQFPEYSDFATIRFGRICEDQNVPTQLAKEFKKYCKEVRNLIRENPKSLHQGLLRRKIFWMNTKLLEHGIFPTQITRIQNYLYFVWDETKDD